MAYLKSTHTRRRFQGLTPGLAEIKAILDGIDASPVLDALWRYRWNGRPGYPLESLWRAHLARYLLNLPSVNALLRQLQDDPTLRLVCGFSLLPHRTTFNRFFNRLANHKDLVDRVLADLTNQLKAKLPNFGEKVAIDSSNVGTYASPNRPLTTDPEASWTAKTRPGDKRKEWHFGYKVHALADATHGLPITSYTTTASRSDMNELSPLLKKAASSFSWFTPTHVIADKGYDSTDNYKAVQQNGAIPVIPMRRLPKGQLREGIYTDDGTPTCVGKIPMDYIRTDLDKGHLYRCQTTGCHLKGRPGMANCLDEVWENRKDNPRLFGPIRRGSQEWNDLYGLRQSVERLFKSLKQARSLDSHCVRGLKKVGLHASLSILTLQATAMHRIRAHQQQQLRWQVRKVG